MPRPPACTDLDYATRAVTLGDVDGDGDLDLACGNGVFAGRQNRLYLNLARQLDAPFLLRRGRTYTLEAYARYGPPSATDIAVVFLSPGTASIPLPPWGTLGLDPGQMVALPPFLIPQPAGVGSVSFTVPRARRNVGVPIYTQALLLQQPFTVRLTNVTGDVILR